ncbi:hypothetical protein, partial [Lysinibacillus sphaericus]|uniref:hypothetical protein n=1 Tax=Lysinibacillus sphaericus TaxID=1421 RepID=UPI000C185E68
LYWDSLNVVNPHFPDGTPIRTDYYNEKRLLAKQKIKIVKWEIIDEYFFDLTITTPGEDQVFRYANMAVKTQVEKLLSARLQIE